MNALIGMGLFAAAELFLALDVAANGLSDSFGLRVGALTFVFVGLAVGGAVLALLYRRSDSPLATVILAAFAVQMAAVWSLVPPVDEPSPTVLAGHLLFFDGTAMSGVYVPDTLRAFEDGGFHDAASAARSAWSRGMLGDAWASLTGLRHRDNLDWGRLGCGPSVLVGYSYGSLLAAQLAIDLADHGCVIEALGLIASPIAPDFLAALKKHPRIGRVTIIDLPNDPIRAGLSAQALVVSAPRLGWQYLAGRVTGRYEGHFALADPTAAGADARRAVAHALAGGRE